MFDVVLQDQKKILEILVPSYIVVGLPTLQIGQKENENVIRGPTHLFMSTALQQCRWKTCPHLSYK